MDKPPEYYENLDLETLVTPLNVTHFIELLKETQYPEQEIEFLQKGFTQGFDIWYEGHKGKAKFFTKYPLFSGEQGGHVEQINERS